MEGDVLTNHSRRMLTVRLLVAALGLLSFGAAPASADEPTVDAGNQGPLFAVEDTGVGVGVEGGQSGATQQPGSAGRHRACTLQPDTSNHSAGAPAWESAEPHTGEDGAWYVLSCDGLVVDMVWLGLRTGEPQPAGRALAERAWRFLPLPAPAARFNPSDPAVVNLPTWFWTEPSSTTGRSVQVGVPGFRVTVTATAVSTSWQPGDGSAAVECAEPSRAYRQGLPDRLGCTHRYLRSSATAPGRTYAARATTRWRVRWTATDGSSGSLPDLRRSTAFQVPVGEVQAVVTGTR